MRTLALAFLCPLLTLTFHASAATCSASTSGVAFGAYNPIQAVPVDSAGSVLVNCTKGALDSLPLTVNYSVDLSRGNSSNYASREMTSSARKLYYNLYRDALRIAVWGDSSGGTVNVPGMLQLQAPLGTASATHAIYGRVFGSQNAVPGGYADSIVVTISY